MASLTVPLTPAADRKCCDLANTAPLRAASRDHEVVGGAVAGPGRVLAIWETLVEDRMSAARRQIFVSRPEVQRLCCYSTAFLQQSALAAQAADPSGGLRVEDWLAAVEAAVAERRRVDLPEQRRVELVIEEGVERAG